MRGMFGSYAVYFGIEDSVQYVPFGIEDSCQVLFDGQTVAEAFFDEDKCACLQKKVNDNQWTGMGPTTYNTAGQKQ